MAAPAVNYRSLVADWHLYDVYVFESNESTLKAHYDKLRVKYPDKDRYRIVKTA